MDKYETMQKKIDEYKETNREIAKDFAALRKQVTQWHKSTETPRTDKELLLYVETMNRRGFVVGYYDEGECLEDYEKVFGWTDFINFVKYDFIAGEVKVIAWRYLPEPPKEE